MYIITVAKLDHHAVKVSVNENKTSERQVYDSDPYCKVSTFVT